MGMITWLRNLIVRTGDVVAPRLKVHLINRFVINKSVPGLGKVMKLEINTELKRIEAEFLLNGEERPIKLTASYTLKGASVKLTQVKADRPWVEALCKRFVPDEPVPIPEWIVESLLKSA